MKKSTFFYFLFSFFLFGFTSLSHSYADSSTNTNFDSSSEALSFLNINDEIILNQSSEEREDAAVENPFCRRRCQERYQREVRFARAQFFRERLQCFALVGFLQQRCLNRAQIAMRMQIRRAQFALRHCLRRCGSLPIRIP